MRGLKQVNQRSGLRKFVGRKVAALAQDTLHFGVSGVLNPLSFMRTDDSQSHGSGEYTAQRKKQTELLHPAQINTQCPHRTPETRSKVLAEAQLSHR